MRKRYLSAPLPFVGQKRNFARNFVKILQLYPEDAIFVDLFGGSGLLAHIAKCVKPQATVVFNDYDDFNLRMRNIPHTNALIDDFRSYVSGIPKKKPITGIARKQIIDRLTEEEREYGYIDYITISGSLLFSMNYKMDLDGLIGEVFYNNIKKVDYPEAKDYLAGLEITHCDYKELYEQYKNVPKVVFLVDPPYLSTNVTTYRMNWNMADYLDVLTILRNHDFVYFTSNKSQILPLCEWMGNNKNIGNPFERCKIIKFKEQMNYHSSYENIMLYADNRMSMLKQHLKTA